MKGHERNDPLHALVAGRWAEWAGLPTGLGLKDLHAVYGGATLLDGRAMLGSTAVHCCCSSLGTVPVLVWHNGGQDGGHSGGHVLRVAHDRLDQPLPAPRDLSPFARLDVVQGSRRVAGGEWVDAAHGLALLVSSNGLVIEAAGFAPTTQQDYVARRRPTRGLPMPTPMQQDTRP